MGAAPQLTYQLLIQLLSDAGYTVSALCCPWGRSLVRLMRCVYASGNRPDGCPTWCLSRWAPQARPGLSLHSDSSSADETALTPVPQLPPLPPPGC